MSENGQDKIIAEYRRRRREYVIMAIAVVAIAVLTYLEFTISHLAEKLPIGNTILFFSLFNIDLVLILLLIFLVVRNLVKLFVDRRRGILGSNLKTKLVLAFAGLTLIPTGVLFFVALKFINYSLESWFDPQISQMFTTSNEIVQSKYEEDAGKVLHFAEALRDYLQDMNLLEKDRRVNLEEFLKFKLKEYDLAQFEVVWLDKRPSMRVFKDNLPVEPQSLTLPADFLEKAFEGQEGYMITPLESDTDAVRGVVPLHQGGPDGPIVAALAVQSLMDKSLFGQMKSNERSYQDYISLMRMKSPIKNTHITLLILICLVVLFSATWFGIYIAKTLVVPIERLADATERVAKGDLHVTVESDARDEMGVLAGSFNKMTRELVASKDELDRAYQALERKNVELDQRRRYMEIVLANVTAGVISIDRDGCISTINKAAQSMFKIDLKEVMGRNHREVLRPDQLLILDDILDDMNRRREGTVRRMINLSVGGSPAIIHVTLTELKDEDGELVGLVGIFENMTHILQAQKAIAWREVARRIAHEIKNPLTPLQLSAERLRRNYLGRIEGDATIFNEATDLIIKQVKELRDLVDEFRNFARMPTAQPAPEDLNQIAKEAMGLYQEAHKHIQFSLSLDPSMPIFDLDRDQIKRMMTNLLDNAVGAIYEKGEIKVVTAFIEPLQIARIEVADTGMGIPIEDRQRIFEPDFSTKKGGSGLGLAIVQRIVSDHYGYIRVRGNIPRGSVFVIELPTHLPRIGIEKPQQLQQRASSS